MNRRIVMYWVLPLAGTLFFLVCRQSVGHQSGRRHHLASRRTDSAQGSYRDERIEGFDGAALRR